jgi:succinylglutamic semialdehyde dehydrogenase
MNQSAKNSIHFIAGRWITGDGEPLQSHDPATGDVVWTGRAATAAEVGAAVAAARHAFDGWAMTSLEERTRVIEAFAGQLRGARETLAEIISREVGKPNWESLTEVDAMIGKAALSIRAYAERRKTLRENAAGATAVTRFKPHGVVAVLGPFNFPGHLPNGHILPALLAGNTVVFKPSEMTPAVAAKTIECWNAAGLPPGVLNLVQGARETGAAIAGHPDIDGLYFTGSVAAGLALHRAFAGQPQKILALELGGNNPLVVWETADLDAAAMITVQSAYITAGQRCSCARRLIISAGAAGDRFVDRLLALLRRIRVGPQTDRPEPFMGPVISAAAAARLLTVQEDLRERGGVELAAMRRVGSGGALLTPGLMDVTAVADVEDAEHFGPFLQLVRVADFDAAIREANRTQFGLCAGLVSDRADLYDAFVARAKAGVINWNRPTTGASGALPFGGIGLSGNHRPSGYYAADYCSYPVASLESASPHLPTTLPGIDTDPRT